MFKKLILLASVFMFGNQFSSGIENNGDLVKPSVEYLKEHRQAPEEYVVSKFDDHDIVFIGEFHRIRHQVKLIHRLIPKLYEAGVFNLGIEFFVHVDQSQIDSLLSSDIYNENLANQIQFNQSPWWGYQEYVEILRAAWNLNRNRPEGVRPFRVIGLSPDMDWSLVQSVEDRNNPEIMKKVFSGGDPDVFMAEIVQQEVLDKGEKALIYSGSHHAFTRYKQPVFYPETGKTRYVQSRMGNVIYEKIGNRCFNIFLHSPWTSKQGYDKWVNPVDGMIEEIMNHLVEKAGVGFDVVDTPLGQLGDTTSYYQHGYPGFTLEQFCDGYIYQKPFTEFQGVHAIPGFINASNRLEAIAQWPDPEIKEELKSRTIDELNNSIAEKTEIQRRFREELIGYFD